MQKDKTKEDLTKEIKLLQKRIAELEILSSKQQQQQQQQQQIRRLAMVVLDSNDAITLKDFNGQITAWNRGAELMYGYSEKEALQMNVWQLTPPDKKVEHTEFIRRLMEGKTVASFETQRVTKDGRVLDVWLTVTKVLDDAGKPIGIASTERDITERKKLDKLLKEIEERYRVLIQALPQVVYEVETDGKFIFVSDGVKQLGYTPEELIGKRFKEIVHPDDFEVVSRFIVLPKYRGRITGAENSPKLFDERRTNGRMTQHLQIRLLRKSQNEAQGDYCYCEIDSIGEWDRPVEDKDKNLLGSIGIIQDITERKKMEGEMRKRLHELEIFYKASIGREERILELKKEIEGLKKELGK